jgi:predicted phage terminase large subunit-like protein
MGLPLGEPDPLGRAAGEAVAPKRYSATELQSIAKDVGSMVFGAEYQGSPRATEGNLIKRPWLRIVTQAAPATPYRIRYWDKAASVSKSAKFSAGVRLAIALDGRVVIEDVVHGQWTTKERRNVMLQTAQLDAAAFNNGVFVFIEQEPGSSGVDSVQDEIALLAGYPVFADKATGDKDVRLMPFIAQAEALNVVLLQGAWNQVYIDEMVVVPNGTYRDQVDATAGAYNRAIELVRTPPARTVVHEEFVSISQF